MAVNKREHVLYVDGLGKEHSALVSSVNQRGDYCPVCLSNVREVRQIVGGEACRDKYHDGEAPTEHYVTIVYIDAHRVESDNVVKVFDVKHISMLERETSPGLPSFHVNCWKYEDEDHEALPEDHPTFDHPFAQLERDQNGNTIPTGRPKFATAIADHRATSLAMAAGAEATKEPLSYEATPETGAQKLGEQAQEVLTMPTPAVNSLYFPPVAEDQKVAEPGTEGNANSALPSAEDLDQVAGEQKAGEETGGLKIETKHYSDGSSATGPAPLPDRSPAQQDAEDEIPDA